MRRTMVLLVPAVMIASGCLGSASDAATATAIDGDAGLTIHDLLKTKSHLAIEGPTTLEFSFASASQQVPRIATTLLHIANDTDTVHVETDAAPLLVALVPHPAAEEPGVCGGLPEGTHADFRPRADDGAHNITDPYEAGWYHAIVVVDEPGTLRLTFGAEQAVEPSPWTTDRTTTPAVRSLTSGHQIGVSLGTTGNAWLAWLAYGADDGALDAGGEQSLRVGDGCVKQTTVAAGTPAVAAAGNGSAAANVLARYTPAQPTLAPETTTLTLIEVTFKPLDPPAAQASATPTTAITGMA